jgi:wobble nucleotide-excising tRNase
MIENLQLLSHLGQFDNVNAGAQLPFAPFTLIYAENGRGKTTVAAIFRSLATGVATPLTERQRMPGGSAPHVVVTHAGGTPLVFQNGRWNSTLPEIVVFDDNFVAQNVCSGLEIGAGHRQNLHELILGAQGVAFNAALQAHVESIENHNRLLREKSAAIPVAVRGNLTVDAFCALEPDAEVDEKIVRVERDLAAAQQSDAIARKPAFAAPTLPSFDIAALNNLLGRTLADIEADAAAAVDVHLKGLGGSGSSWVNQGVEFINSDRCPFCAQDMKGSPLIAHYQAYFSAAYGGLKESISQTIRQIRQTHADDMPAAFERAVLTTAQASEFWRQFADVPTVELDTAAISLAWKQAREVVLTALARKQSAPLESITFTQDDLSALAHFEDVKQPVVDLAAQLALANEAIALVKERAANANVGGLTTDLARLRMVQQRYGEGIAPLCEDYIGEKTAKAATEEARDQARQALDNYRNTAFPPYEAAINDYLSRLNAAFRLSGVTSVNHRTGTSVSYSMVINNVAVPVTNDTVGAPAFANTLSSGDRNTLALALFFASIDRSGNAANKVVVIDDPMTSLDEHRTLSTVQEIKRLRQRVSQVIVLSHSKQFLWQLWNHTPTAEVAAIKITREAAPQNIQKSTLETWNVHQDSIMEHDRHHETVQSYIAGTYAGDPRDAAIALRPILEQYVRVAYPGDFPPGGLLGPFINTCTQRLGMANQILNPVDTTELRDLVEYGNQFHHNTNQAWQTVLINDQELLRFAQRTITFTRRA